MVVSFVCIHNSCLVLITCQWKRQRLFSVLLPITRTSYLACSCIAQRSIRVLISSMSYGCMREVLLSWNTALLVVPIGIIPAYSISIIRVYAQCLRKLVSATYEADWFRHLQWMAITHYYCKPCVLHIYAAWLNRRNGGISGRDIVCHLDRVTCTNFQSPGICVALSRK